MWKWLKRFFVLVLVVVLFCVFAYHDGIQHVLALFNDSTGAPELDALPDVSTANCDGASPCTSGPIAVLTYNVLCRMCAKEHYEPWDQRVPHILELIGLYAPDLMGLQELGGMADITEILGEDSAYDFVAYELGNWVYGDCALFFLRERFELLDSGQLWLSPKPEVPMAKGWLALSVPRYMNWAYLRQRENGFRFLYINTHFDNNGRNKNPSAELFAERFGPLAEAVPIILTGDFNTERGDHRFEVIRYAGGNDVVFAAAEDIAAEKEMVSNLPEGQQTPGGESFWEDAERLIDHIFLAGPVEKQVNRWVVDRSVYGPDLRRPSDHPAVFAEVELTVK